MPADRGDRRRHERLSLRLPVRVKARSRRVGCGRTNRLRRRLQRRPESPSPASGPPGTVAALVPPLPSRFRQYDLTDHSYRVYALVRSVVRSGEDGARVGLLFYGKRPPQGEESLPAGLFLMPGDEGFELGLRRAQGVPLVLRLTAEQAPGALALEEQAAAECVRAWDARVRISSLPAMKGAIVLVEGVGGSFRTRAEVRHIVIGTDGDPRLDLAFLDAPAPTCSLTDDDGKGHQEAPGSGSSPTRK